MEESHPKSNVPRKDGRSLYKTFSVGFVRAKIWKRTVKAGPSTGIYWDFSVCRMRHPMNSDWCETDMFLPEDLGDLQAALSVIQKFVSAT